MTGPADTEAVLPPVRMVFAAMVATIAPEAAALDAEGWALVEQTVEDALRDRPPVLKRQLRLAIRAVQWMPLLRYARTFTSLNASQRARFLASLESHRLQIVRVGFWGLRTLALLGYYARPEAAREIGYDADPRGWEKLTSGKTDEKRI